MSGGNIIFIVENDRVIYLSGIWVQSLAHVIKMAITECSNAYFLFATRADY